MLKLDESLFQFIDASDDQSSEVQEVDSPANAAAHNSRNDIKKELKKQLKDHEKNKEAFIKINHEREPKNSMKTKEMKKLHLSESLFEGSAVLERPATRQLYYKAKRGPLADIIQDELTTGEVVYSQSSTGGWNPTFTPSLNLPEEHVGVMYDDSGNVFIEVKVGDPEMASQVEAIGRKYNKETTISGPVAYADKDKQYIIRIQVDESDFDGNYVDPDVPTRPVRSKK